MAQHANGPRPRPTNGRTDNGNGKSNKFADVGAAAGGFVGAMGGSFVPPINVTVNRTTNKNGQRTARAGQSRSHAESVLASPEFTSPAQLRNYCNTLRAAAVTMSIEVAMGAEILKGVLAAVPDPEGKPFGSRIRAQKVARKLQKSADNLRDAAKEAAAAYSTFQQQYEEEINRVRHRARRPQQARMDWAQQ